MSYRIVKLSDVVTINPKTITSTFSSDEDVAFIAMADVSEEGKLENVQTRTFEDVKKGYTCFQNGDVLLAKITPCFENGKATIVDSLFSEIGFGSTEFHVLRPTQEMDGRFLFHLIWNENFRRAGTNRMTGSAGQKRVPTLFLENYEINLPPLEEQKRIAAILDKADSLRRKRALAIALADDFLRATFLEMFGDPVTNPKGWPVVSAEKMIKVQGGYAFQSSSFGSVGIPVVKIGNANKVGFTASKIDFVQPDDMNRLKQYELYPGDLLMSLTGTVGKDDYGNITEVSDEYPMYYLNQRVAKISFSKSDLKQSYIRNFFNHEKIKIEITKRNRGVRQANISNSDLYELIIPLPPFELQERFEEMTRLVLRNTAAMKKQKLLADNLLNSLSDMI